MSRSSGVIRYDAALETKELYGRYRDRIRSIHTGILATTTFDGRLPARFQHTVRSCCSSADTYGLGNLEMLDLRSLGVLEQTTKLELAALLTTARCEHLLTLRVVLVEERANGVALDMTNEGREMPLQNQNLGPDDVQLVAGWLCSLFPRRN